MKYATKKKRNGETPYIDPYATNPCRQVYGKKKKTAQKLFDKLTFITANSCLFGLF